MNSPYSTDLCIDYKSPSDGFGAPTEAARKPSVFRKRATSARQGAVASRKLGRRTRQRGAVRMHAPDNGTARRLMKFAAMVLVVASGSSILATTASTSKVTPSSFKAALLTVTPDKAPMPTFRFDDAEAVASTNTVTLADITTIRSKKLIKPSIATFAPQAAASLWPESDIISTDNTISSERVIDEPAMGNLPILRAGFSHSPFEPVAPELPAQKLTPPAPEPSPQENVVKTITVESGDTLSGILANIGLAKHHVASILADESIKPHLSTLRIGTDIHFEYLWDGQLDNIRFKANRDTRIHMQNTKADVLKITAQHLPIEYERVVTSGTIEQSLYLAAEKANLKQSTIMELSDIFEWELDFARDIRKGDKFNLVYDRLYRDGKYIGDGDILAAEFVRGDRSHTAVRFTDSEGNTDYYSPDGQSKRRAFMRHPVDVVRITSHFDPNRLHPVLHKIRAHRGVDYGAPYGSPIYATADGKIAFAGDKNAYGTTVILKHGDNRSTLYAHMSKLAKTSKAGKRVKRGDIIGFVGKSGRVTGTHLHYEFRIAGKHVDPLKVELPGAPPLAKKYRAALKDSAQELFAQRRSVEPVEERLASAE